MLVKILGAMDLAASLAFLMLVFGVPSFVPFTLFCACLLFLKGLFIFTGDILSVIDIFSSIILIVSIFFFPPMFLLWVPGFLLLAKGVVSFF